jgi:hypothetical protein
METCKGAAMNQISRTWVSALTGGLRRLLAATALALLLAAVQMQASLAAGNSSARAVAMGGAYIGLATGVDAAKYNPANLGLTDYTMTSIQIAGAGIDLSNNSFTLGDYNDYTGAFLTEADKADILDKIPAEGLRLNARAEAAAASIASGPFAFVISGVGAADVSMNKDLFDLILNGNTLADTVRVDGSYSDAVSYVSVGLSYGHAVYNSGTRQLAAGITAKYIKGLYVERITELEGLASTELSGFAGEGRAILQAAEGGSGYGLDLGAVLQLNDTYTVGASITNVLGSISWKDSPTEYGYIFSFDTTNFDNMSGDHVVSDDYKRSISGFSTTLPSELRIGVAKTSGDILWAIDFEQGLEDTPGVSTKPRLNAGVEWAPVSTLPLRMGYGVGGERSSGFSFGTGIHASAARVDFAFVTGNTFSGYSAKGANLALSLGLAF